MTTLTVSLRQRREYIGLTVAGLAMESGVDAQIVAMIESGRITLPPREILASLARALHTDVADLEGAPAQALRARFGVIRGGRITPPVADQAAGPEVA